VIIDINKLTNFLIYNENINRYTFISLYNKVYYGKIIDDQLLKHLIKICAGVLNIIYTKLNEQNERDSLSKLIQYLTNIKYNDSFIFEKTLKLQFMKLQPKLVKTNTNHSLSMFGNSKLMYGISDIKKEKIEKIKKIEKEKKEEIKNYHKIIEYNNDSESMLVNPKLMYGISDIEKEKEKIEKKK
jgi:hypothetical protein